MNCMADAARSLREGLPWTPKSRALGILSQILHSLSFSMVQRLAPSVAGFGIDYYAVILGMAQRLVAPAHLPMV